MTRPSPGLPVDLPWINAAGPIDVARDLAGHVVLLYFWTASCVHSRQGLRALARLEQRFAGEPVTVVGVHCGRFPHERGRDAVADAVDRWDVRFPVVVDAEFAAWRLWDVGGWPHLAVIDASGTVVYEGLGEPHAKRLERSIARLLDDARAAATLAIEAFVPRLPAPRRSPTGLRYPTKVLVDDTAGLLWISDTGHHRVLGVGIDTGRVQHVVGSGIPGFADGAAADAALCGPTGLAVQGGQLWIADTGNHVLRTYDPGTGIVHTAMGTGRRERDTLGGYCGRDQGLHSPGAMAVWEDPARGPALLVAMRGGHQLWVVDVDTMVATAVVGTGAMGSLDDRDDHASLAEPAGLVAHGYHALWVDGATGRVRAYDGGARETRLVLNAAAVFGIEELSDVAWDGGDSAWVSDAGRDQVWAVHVAAGTAEAVKDLALRGPEGLAVHGDRGWIVDTGSHRVLAWDLVAGTAALWSLIGLPPPHASTGESTVAAEWIEGGEVLLRVHLALPMGARVESDAGVDVRVVDGGDGVLAESLKRTVGAVGATATVPGVRTASGSGEVLVEASYLARTDVEGAWHRRVQRWVVEVTLSHGGSAAQDLR